MAKTSLTKVCRNCERELPINFFYKNGNYYRPECKECKNKAESERRAKDVEVSRSKDRERYRKNREKEITSMKRYRENLKETNYLKYFIQNNKKAVIREGIEWDLDEKFLEELFTGVCPVFGCPIHLGGRKEDCKAELDRLIPSKGYTKGNVRWISSRANRIKSDASIDEIKKIIKYMEEQIELS